MTLYICSLAAIHDVVARTGASHLLTVISGGTQVDRPKSITEDNHLFLEFNDITAPAQGLVPPSPAHVEKILAFGQSWDRKAPMVVHCWAGVSRSTAAGYILSHALTPDSDPYDLPAFARPRALGNAQWPHGELCRRIIGRQRRDEGCHRRHRARRHGL